jgi:hypothetical protein
MFWYFFTYYEFDRNTQSQHNTTNITTMVVEPLAPTAHGFNESTPPEGRVALRISFPRPLSKDFV